MAGGGGNPNHDKLGKFSSGSGAATQHDTHEHMDQVSETAHKFTGPHALSMLKEHAQELQDQHNTTLAKMSPGPARTEMAQAFAKQMRGINEQIKHAGRSR